MSLNQKSLDEFCDMLGQFLNACLYVWPNDESLNQYKVGFDVIMNPALGSLGNSGKQKLIQEYHDSMSPYYLRCSQKDPTLFTEEHIPILEECNLREKWLSNISQQTRETIWDYISKLNRLCQMHVSLFSRVPESMLGKIQTLSNDLSVKIAQGEVNFQDLDLASIGQEVVSGMTEEEMQTFMTSIMSDPSAIANLASTMAPGGQGVDPAMIAQVMGGAGISQDLPAQIMSMMMQQSMGGN